MCPAGAWDCYDCSVLYDERASQPPQTLGLGQSERTGRWVPGGLPLKPLPLLPGSTSLVFYHFFLASFLGFLLWKEQQPWSSSSPPHFWAQMALPPPCGTWKQAQWWLAHRWAGRWPPGRVHTVAGSLGRWAQAPREVRSRGQRPWPQLPVVWGLLWLTTLQQQLLNAKGKCHVSTTDF